MASTALLRAGAEAGADRASPKVLRATVAMGIAAFGAAASLIFAVMAREQCAGAGATGLFVTAIIFAVALVVAWFQRTLEKQIVRLSIANDRYDQENKEFSEANRINALENDRLRRNNEELESEVDRLGVEAQNLNVLYNQSVNMVRQLALFGDECKTLGHDLKDVASDLKETDDSLGLTAGELERQTAAIRTATAALMKVAQAASA